MASGLPSSHPSCAQFSLPSRIKCRQVTPCERGACAESASGKVRSVHENRPQQRRFAPDVNRDKKNRLSIRKTRTLSVLSLHQASVYLAHIPLTHFFQRVRGATARLRVRCHLIDGRCKGGHINAEFCKRRNLDPRQQCINARHEIARSNRIIIRSGQPACTGHLGKTLIRSVKRKRETGLHQHRVRESIASKMLV